MNIEQFKKENKVESEFELKDGRVIFTTHNGFKYWIANAKGIVEQVERYWYAKAKQHILTKRMLRERARIVDAKNHKN